MNELKYRSLQGYKFQLVEDFHIQLTGFSNLGTIITKFINITNTGILTIKEGYAWDGASGTPFQTETFMRGALVHDALYQLMRERFLDYKVQRQWADDLLIRLCREDGMNDFRCWYVKKSVDLFGEQFAKPIDKKIEEHTYIGKRR